MDDAVEIALMCCLLIVAGLCGDSATFKKTTTHFH